MTRSVYTTVTPLPAGIPRRIVRECLHDHFLMIDLNPLVIKRERMPKALSKATPEEFHCTWYEITDRISYFPGVKGQVTYHGCFHDLEDGLQTHIYAPMGLDIKEKWTVGGNEPGEPRQTAELGIQAPKDGLYLREDVDVSVNMMLLSFVKKNLVNAHKELVDRMVEKTKLMETKSYNESIQRGTSQSIHSGPQSSGQPSPSMTQSHPAPNEGYTSPSSVYDERYGPDGHGWHNPSPGPYNSNRPISHTGAAPPYENYPGNPPKQMGGYAVPGYNKQAELSPQDPSARYRMTLDHAANPPPQELPATSDKPPAELE